MSEWCYEFGFAYDNGGWTTIPVSGKSYGIYDPGTGWIGSRSGAVYAIYIGKTWPASTTITRVEMTVYVPPGGLIGPQSNYSIQVANIFQSGVLQENEQIYVWNGSTAATYIRINPNDTDLNLTVSKVLVHGIGMSPFVPSYSLETSLQVPDQDAYIYFAPITGNPTQENLTVNNNTRPIIIDSYAIDPLTKNLWLHAAQGWLKATTSDFTGGVVLKPNGCHWERDDNYMGADRIIVAENALGNFKLPLQEILNCISNGVTNATSDYPLGNVPWPTQDSVPIFSFLPISLEQLCSSTRTELHGMGYYVGSGNPYNNPDSHPGVDFFAPAGSNVYSIADNGLVVGIGVEGFDTRSASRWGSASVDEGTGFSVIVRYGHLYVLYGHLLEINETIFVDKQVNKGDILGSLGTFPDSEPHLHLEVRSYGASVTSGALVQDSQGDDNDYGILKLGPEQALNVYDCIQFFDENTQIIQRDNVNDSPLAVIGLGVVITDQDTVSFGTPTVSLTCSLSQPLTLTYRTDVGNVGEVVSLNGNTYRGFVLLAQSVIDPFDPADATA